MFHAVSHAPDSIPDQTEDSQLNFSTWLILENEFLVIRLCITSYFCIFMSSYASFTGRLTSKRRQNLLSVFVYSDEDVCVWNGNNSYISSLVLTVYFMGHKIDLNLS